MSDEYSEEKISITPDFNEESVSDMNDPLVNPAGFSDDIPINDDLADEANPLEHPPLGEMAIPYTAPPLEKESPADKDVVSRSVFYNAPMNEAASQDITIDPPNIVSTTLLNREESGQFRARWNEIQGKFVDDPRSAVQEADALVSELVEKITRMFTTERGDLESQWKAGDVVSTEDLRKALQHYRSFFNRLVG